MSDGINDAEKGFDYYMWGKPTKKAGFDYSEGHYIPDRDKKRRFTVGVEEMALALNDFRPKGCQDQGWLNIVKARIKEAAGNTQKHK
jgi:hypothetical protein